MIDAVDCTFLRSSSQGNDVNANGNANANSTLCPFPQSYGLCELQDTGAASPTTSTAGSTTGSTATTATTTTTPRSLQQVLIPFNYELYYGDVSEPPLDFVQGLLLEKLAEDWNLPDCRRSSSTRGRQLTATSNGWSVVAMTSTPADVVDPTGTKS